MKLLISTALFLSLSPFVMASSNYVGLMNIDSSSCPQLSGTYRCQDPLGSVKTVTVTQEGNHFQLKGLAPLEELVADGENYNVANSSYYRNANYVASCHGHYIQAKVRGDVYQNGFYLGNANVNVKLSKDLRQNLVSEVKGSLRGPIFQTPISEKLTCQKSQ